MNTFLTIVIILNIIILITMPIIPMIIQWHIDPVIKATYTQPWLLSQLDGNSRAYHQHLVNHALIAMCGVFWAFTGGWLYWLGLAVFIFGKVYPFIKEFWWDVRHGKPNNGHDWRERLAGDLFTLPLFLVASWEFFK